MENLLNQEQKNAVLHNESSLLIVAGAGTGKTKTLTSKIIFLIKNGVLFKNILALTFTNKAAGEMLERVRKETLKSPFMGTFHSFCVKILRTYGEYINIKRNFIIFDEKDSRSAVRNVLKDIGSSGFSAKVIRNAISKIKTEMYIDKKSAIYKKAQKVLPLYEEYLKNSEGLDFDDLIIKTIYLLKKHTKIRKALQEKYKYILIDEYQDIDILQEEIITLLYNKNNKVIAVGDADQTIYTWRGANINNMLNFTKKYSPAKKVTLTKNYRSTSNILESANVVISKNINRLEKDLVATRESGDLIQLLPCYDEEAEADLISKEIKRLFEKKAKPNDIAILFRANFLARAIELKLLEHEIPYFITGARFFDRLEIKGLVSYIQLIQNKKNKIALLTASKINKSGIGIKTIDKMINNENIRGAVLKKVDLFKKEIDEITQFSKENSLSETILKLIEILDYENYLEKTFVNKNERMSEVRELISFSKKFDNSEEGIDDFLAEVSLGSDQDSLKMDKSNSVKLMTIHGAKGLEFDNVFISGLEEGLFPLIKEEGVEDNVDTEEERRLFYVALTRARDRVCCSFAKRRGYFGRYRDMEPSRFLVDIYPKTEPLNESENSILW